MKAFKRRIMAYPAAILLMCAMTFSVAALPITRYIIMETSTYIFTVGDLLFIISLIAAVMTIIFTLIFLKVEEIPIIPQN